MSSSATMDALNKLVSHVLHHLLIDVIDGVGIWVVLEHVNEALGSPNTVLGAVEEECKLFLCQFHLVLGIVLAPQVQEMEAHHVQRVDGRVVQSSKHGCFFTDLQLVLEEFEDLGVGMGLPQNVLIGAIHMHLSHW